MNVGGREGSPINVGGENVGGGINVLRENNLIKKIIDKKTAKKINRRKIYNRCRSIRVTKNFSSRIMSVHKVLQHSLFFFGYFTSIKNGAVNDSCIS